MWGATKLGSFENMNRIAIFKLADDTKFALVSGVSPDRPMMGHIEEAHAF
jgi:hypothetical protein